MTNHCFEQISPEQTCSAVARAHSQPLAGMHFSGTCGYRKISRKAIQGKSCVHNKIHTTSTPICATIGGNCANKFHTCNPRRASLRIFLSCAGGDAKTPCTALRTRSVEVGWIRKHPAVAGNLARTILSLLSGCRASATLSTNSRRGEVSERLKEPASKAGSLAKPGSWVRIPPSPPFL